MDSLQLLDYFTEQVPATIEAITEIVEIETPSFNFQGSRAAADWIEKGFHVSGVECESKRFTEEAVGEHLLVRFAGRTAKKPILLLGHSDTVHPLGSLSKNPTRIEDGRLYGCGTFDMKANIAVMIEVFKAFGLFGLRPERPVNVLIACDEEVGSETGRPHVEREALESEFCLVFEPSLDGMVKTGRKGTAGYVMKTFGTAAHAGLDPEKGVSAVLEISRQIQKLHRLSDLAAGITVTVGTVKGGTATNVVPGEAECTIDVRFETLEEAARFDTSIRSLEAFDPRVRIEIDGEVNRPPMKRTDGVFALFEKARGIAAEFGYELSETQVGGASDGNFVGALGIPLLDGLGVAGNGAHTLHEYIEIEDIPKRAVLLAKLLLQD